MGLKYIGIYDFFSLTLLAGTHQHGNTALCVSVTSMTARSRMHRVYGRNHYQIKKSKEFSLHRTYTRRDVAPSPTAFVTVRDTGYVPGSMYVWRGF